MMIAANVFVSKAGDIGTTGVPLAVAPIPIAVPGALMVKTSGARAVRIQARFAAPFVAGNSAMVYLATGTSSTTLVAVNQNPQPIGFNETDVSFVTEGLGDWACVYYTAAVAPTPNLSSLTMTILP